MTEPEPIETFPLFPDLEPCGCPKDQGHTCRPPFAAPFGWPRACVICGAMRPGHTSNPWGCSDVHRTPPNPENRT